MKLTDTLTITLDGDTLDLVREFSFDLPSRGKRFVSLRFTHPYHPLKLWVSWEVPKATRATIDGANEVFGFHASAYARDMKDRTLEVGHREMTLDEFLPKAFAMAWSTEAEPCELLNLGRIYSV